MGSNLDDPKDIATPTTSPTPEEDVETSQNSLLEQHSLPEAVKDGKTCSVPIDSQKISPVSTSDKEISSIPTSDKGISSVPTSNKNIFPAPPNDKNKKAEYTPRNQHVLGLKYIHAKYGRSNRYQPINFDDRVYACNNAQYNGFGIPVSCFDQY